MLPKWLTFADVMEITGFSRDKVTQLVRRGEIPMFKIGGEWRITRKAWERAEQRMEKRGEVQ